MNKEHTQTQLHNLILSIVVALAFMMPLFFLPLTVEFYEFNKLALLVSATILGMVLWAAKVILSKKLHIAKSPLDAPILVLAIVFVLSSIFSTSKLNSIYGSQGRWMPSLMGFLAMVAFFYILSSNIRAVRTVKMLVVALLAGISVSTILSILSYYGIYLGQEAYLRISHFTTTGSTTTASIMAALATILGYTLFSKETKLSYKVALGVAVAVNFFFAIVTNTVAGWTILALGLVSFLLLTPAITQQKSISVLALNAVILGTAILVFFPATREIIVHTPYPKEVKLQVKDSWIVASSTLRDFPILGSGPSTFYLNFPRYKTLALNSTDYWNVRFDKPFSEVFDIIGSLGILGILAVVYFTGKAVRYVVKNRNTDETATILLIGLMGIATTFVLSYATVLTTFVFFLLLGLYVATVNARLYEAAPDLVYFKLEATQSTNSIGVVENSSAILRIVIATPLLAIAVAGGWHLSRVYPGEVYMRKAVLAATNNNGMATYEYQTKAINHNNRKDTYRNAYVQTNLALVRALATKQDRTEQDNATIQTLISEAITSSKLTTELLNPLSPANWEIRANVYKTLMGTAANADQWAIAALEKAVQLDPNNPRLRLELGGIYYAKGDYLAAANLFRQATSLKPDYANGYYNFAQALKNMQDYGSAIKALQIAQSLVGEGTADYTAVTAEIEQLKNLPAVAGAQSNQPTVEQLENAAQEQEVTQQEPLVNEGEEVISPESVIPQPAEE